jgi:hypothetical protein
LLHLQLQKEFYANDINASDASDGITRTALDVSTFGA